MILIVGCGNFIMGDDGLGIHLVKKMEKMDLPDHVTVVDAGTRALDVLLGSEGVNKVIVVDAVRFGGEPGTVYRLAEGDLGPPDSSPLSLHDFGLDHSIKAAKRALGKKFPKTMIIFGVEVESVKLGTELSSRVKGALPSLIDHILKEL